jgi:NitT/TauT family transport system substrate-binding protein
MPYFSQAPLFIAQEEGYFAEQKIDAEFIPMPASSSALTAALLSGELDVGTGTPRIAEFNAIAHGARIRYVADKGHAQPGECSPGALVVRRDLTGKGGSILPENLRGARARSQAYSYFEFILDKALKTIGLTLSDLELVSLPTALVEDAFAKKQIALSYLAEVDLDRSVKHGHGIVWKSIVEIEPVTQFSILIFGPRLLDKDRELGIRFLCAYLKGVRRYNAGKTPRNVEIIARRIHRDPQDVRDACWTPIRSDGRLVAPDWARYQAWAAERGTLTDRVPLEKLIDSTLAAEASRRIDASGFR